MIAVALSRIQEDFSLSFTDASWLISTYYLASGIGQPVMGKLADAFGAKRMYVIGLLMIVVSSVAAPFSPSFGWLIGIRVIQAIGSSALFPSGMAMIRASITENQAQALGVLSIFSSVSAAFGPSIGGFLVHFGDWPAIFIINFPIIIAAFVLAIKVLPQQGPKAERKKANIDYPGIVLFSLMIVFWLLFLLDLEKGFSFIKLLSSIVFTILFYIVEKKRNEPFVDVIALKKNTNMSLVYVQFILVNIVFYSIFFGIPLYLQDFRHFDSNTTGLVMLAVAGFGVIVSPITGRWIDRSGSKPPLLAGALSIIIGSLLLVTIQNDSSVPWLFFCLSVLGLSNGFNNLGLQTALYSFVPPAETGAASGLFMTSRYIGTILSSSLLGILFGQLVTTEHLHSMAWTSVIIGGLVLLLTARMPGGKVRRKLQGER
ncbi:MFS transporter [Peribacillus deserti]|uniref:MFS transporter n=2 Tax=Peribacillus deserti TaxID=673318 RepID=A0A2N5M6V7_9BACI|nr:MFS transporter [Peribacillus deserti]